MDNPRRISSYPFQLPESGRYVHLVFAAKGIGNAAGAAGLGLERERLEGHRAAAVLAGEAERVGPAEQQPESQSVDGAGIPQHDADEYPGEDSPAEPDLAVPEVPGGA